MTNKALQTALDTSLGYCAEYRKIIEDLDRKVASQAEKIGELEAAVQDRNSQLERFAEAYKTLKTGLTFYEAQATQAKEQHYQLRKQYETGLEEQKQKLLATFKELSTRYEANAKQEIAKAVKSVKANERSAEEICRSFATGLLKDFERVLPGGVEGLRDAVRSLGQALKRIPELKEIVQEQFREWREAVWERVTGKPYHQELEGLSGGRGGSGRGGRGGSDEPDRGGGWER